MIRFLMIVSAYPPAKTAGMERAAQRLAEGVARLGHRAIVLTQAAAGLPAEESGVEGRLVVRRVLRPVAIGPLWGLTYMVQTARWARRLASEWDFLLCHKLDLHSVSAGWAARRLHKPWANLLHNTEPYSDVRRLRAHKGGLLLLKQALRADGQFVLSDISRAELVRAGYPPDRIHAYRNFLDDETFERAEAEDSSERKGFLCLGRFHRQKNIPLLIDAYERVYTELPKDQLLLVGKGPEERAILSAVARSPARNAIRIDAWTDSPIRLLGRARALVLSSDSEGMPYTVVEAMAAGTPVIATDVSGIRDTLDPNGAAGNEPPPAGYITVEAGLIVRRGDAEALAAAMKRLAGDAELARKLGMAGRRIARQRFAADSCVGLFLEGVEKIRRRSAP